MAHPIDCIPQTVIFDAPLDAGPRFPAATGGPTLTFDLFLEAERLRGERAWTSGRNAKTLVKHSDCRLVLTVMKAGAQMHQHRAKGSVCIQPVCGHLRIHALDGSFELRSGQILSLDPNLAHDVEAVEDTTFLVSIAWPGDSQPTPPRKFDASSNGSDWMQDESVWD